MSLEWRKIDKTKLREHFVADLEELFNGLPHRFIVTYGFRTTEEQKALHEIYLAGGPKAAAPGESAHEFGLAVDVVARKQYMGKPTWDLKDPAWVAMLAAVKAHPRLQSLVKVGDAGHIQRYQWRKHKQS